MLKRFVSLSANETSVTLYINQAGLLNPHTHFNMLNFICSALILLAAAANGQRRSTTTTTEATTTEAEDAIVTLVKGYIDAGTCGTVSSNENCGDDAESYYNEFTYNGQRVIISSQIPDHEAEHDQIIASPLTRCERWQYTVIPLNPSKSATGSSTSLGTTGLAVTGGVFFNHKDANGDVALAIEGITLDSCFGHSAATGAYHYHANIACDDAGAASGANDADECVHIGYFRDEVPVYGYCNDGSGTEFTSCYSLVDGADTSTVKTAGGTFVIASTTAEYEYNSADYASGACNLDEGNGAVHPTTGEYSYFMTTGYPWVPIYNFGEDGASSLCSAA